MDHTFVMVKPDGVARGLVGEVVSRLERRGLRISALRMVLPDEDLASRHYSAHAKKPFYRDLVSFITSGPVVAMVVSGDSAVDVVRGLVGATDPKGSPPGTIRGDLAIDIGRNVVHASDSAASAASEIALWFGEGEIIEHVTAAQPYLYER
ncbi:MAG: nucleoside-diphosphate kinase [Thermoplasmata archaeon]|nr:nucleoside-diphosphate kinase [Thermoplasmata archaeon]